MATRERRETAEEFEARLQRQQEEVEAGANDNVLAENVRYLERHSRTATSSTGRAVSSGWVRPCRIMCS